MFDAPAAMSFSARSVVAPANGSATVDVTIAANALVERGLYSGYITFTPQGGGAAPRVSYAGLKGDYQTTRVLTPGINGFPWLAQRVGALPINRPNGATYTISGGDIPARPAALGHPSRRILLEAFDADTGKAWHRVSLDEYVTRNSTMTGFLHLLLGRHHVHRHGQERRPSVHRAQ